MLADFHMIVRCWRCRARHPVRRFTKRRDQRPRRGSREAFEDGALVQDDARKLTGIELFEPLVIRDPRSRPGDFRRFANVFGGNAELFSLALMLRTNGQRGQHQHGLVGLLDDNARPFECAKGFA